MIHLPRSTFVLMGGCRASDERHELLAFHVWMAPAWQEIIWRAAQRSLAVMCPACCCSPGGLLAMMGSANRVLIIRTGSMSRSNARFGSVHWTPNRLADCFRIGCIVLVALDVRLHVLRRHQSHLMPKRAQLPRPVVRRRARLQANQTWRQSTEERQNLRTPKLLAHNRRSLCIDPVHLKNMLRQVQSDRSNLAHGWLPRC